MLRATCCLSGQEIMQTTSHGSRTGLIARVRSTSLKAVVTVGRLREEEIQNRPVTTVDLSSKDLALCVLASF